MSDFRSLINIVTKEPLCEWQAQLARALQTINQSGGGTTYTQTGTAGNAGTSSPPRRTGGTSGTAYPHHDPTTYEPPRANAVRKTIGRTKVVYQATCNAETKAFLETGIQRAGAILAERGLGWVTDTEISINRFNNHGAALASNGTIWLHPNFPQESTALLRGELVHEFGHRLHHIRGGALDREIKKKYEEAFRNPSLFASDYARTDKQEFWAEAFQRWVIKQPSGPLYRWVGEMVRRYGAR